MMKKLSFVLGAAVGYVLGTRAGRQRYEQISQQAKRLWQSDTVQQRVDQAGEVVGEAVKKTAPKLSALASDGVEKVSKLVSSADKHGDDNSSSSRGTRAGNDSNAESPVGTAQNPAD